MAKNPRKGNRPPKGISKGKINKELSDLANLADTLSSGEPEPDTMFRFKIKVPYSEAPALKPDVWQTEQV